MFVHPINAADIQFGDNKPEVQIPDWRLKIICPKCGYVFYVCDVGEIFMNEPVSWYTNHCKPANSNVPILAPGSRPVCPLDNAEPTREAPPVNGERTSQVFTNKGWMPTRFRPRWQ